MAEDDRQNKFILKQMIQNLKTGQALTEQAQKSIQVVSGHVKEVLGPFGEAADFLKDTMGNVGNFFKGIGQDLGLLTGGKSIEEEQLDEQEKQTDFLEGILDSLIDDQKREFREQIGKKDKKTAWGLILGIFGAIAFAIGAALGGIVRSIVLPFEVLWKGLKFVFGGVLTKIGDIFGGIFRMFLKMPGVRKLAKRGDKMIDFFKGIGRFFTRFRKIFKIFRPVADLFKKFGAGFLRGFKILGWPLTILMGVIDFIRGFMAAEGDILTKIQAGVQEAFKGFFELPVKLIGWIIDKILGLFGVQIEGGAAKGYMSYIDNVIDLIFKFIRNPFDVLMAGVKGLGDWFQELWNGLMDGLIKIAEKVPSWLGGGAIVSAAEALKFDKAAGGDEVAAAENQRRAAQGALTTEGKQLSKDQVEAQKTMSKKLDKMSDSQQEAATILVAQGTRKEADPKEPPGMQESAAIWLETMM